MTSTAAFRHRGKSYSPADSDPVSLCFQLAFAARGSRRKVSTTVRRGVLQTAWGELFGYAVDTVQVNGEPPMLINEWIKIIPDKFAAEAWLRQQREAAGQLLGPSNHIAT